ncbi:hypothetical protein ND748_00325 [Frankia sp. AiPs1]|uniref:hypothetical protein n=1 Tax=Frankia sp. AiPs1 TaxID=573493 RepID=UPI0020444481|nr:hypothetical protein [Frankia sp. AiPs1]MCM3920142.1 hypothetical protein [Frankia sp. AiPs1]
MSPSREDIVDGDLGLAESLREAWACFASRVAFPDVAGVGRSELTTGAGSADGLVDPAACGLADCVFADAESGRDGADRFAVGDGVADVEDGALGHAAGLWDHASRLAHIGERPAVEYIRDGLAINIVGGGEAYHALVVIVVSAADLAGEIRIEASSCSR